MITDGTTKTYTTSYTYNYVGGLTSITYPNGKVVNTVRDTMGRETKVSSTVAGQNVDFVRSAAYLGPHGGLTEVQYGIKYVYWPATYLKTTIAYAPETLRVTYLETHGLKYSYNYIVPGTYPHQQTGHIYDIADGYNAAKSYHYDYDRWYRLKEFWVSNQRADPYSRKMTWTYDPYGNMTTLLDDFDPEHNPAQLTTSRCRRRRIGCCDAQAGRAIMSIIPTTRPATRRARASLTGRDG